MGAVATGLGMTVWGFGDSTGLGRIWGLVVTTGDPPEPIKSMEKIND